MQLSEIKSKLEKADREKAVLEEKEKDLKKRLKEIMNELQSEYGIKTIPEAKREIEKIRQDLEEKVKQIDSIDVPGGDVLEGLDI